MHAATCMMQPTFVGYYELKPKVVSSCLTHSDHKHAPRSTASSSVSPHSRAPLAILRRSRTRLRPLNNHGPHATRSHRPIPAEGETAQDHMPDHSSVLDGSLLGASTGSGDVNRWRPGGARLATRHQWLMAAHLAAAVAASAAVTMACPRWRSAPRGGESATLATRLRWRLAAHWTAAMAAGAMARCLAAKRRWRRLQRHATPCANDGAQPRAWRQWQLAPTAATLRHTPRRWRPGGASRLAAGRRRSRSCLARRA